MGRAELFEQEKKQREDEEAKRKSGGFSVEYEDIDYTSLETDKVKVFRFVGNPFTVRQENWDPKMVLSSRIVDDKKGLFTVKWSEDKNWILWKIYNDVMKYTWDKNAIDPSTGKPGVKVYNLALKYPNVFNRIRWNGKENPNAMERGWTPSRSVMMNCICRDEYEWHKENKSFKLIAKKSNTVEKDGKDITYYEGGIGTTVYDGIIKAVVEEHGAWEDFDIAIRKEDKDPWYSVYSFFDARKIQKELNCEMNGDPLTEEELSWKKFDIDKITQVTSYRKILNRLGDFVKEVDGCLKTHYFDELTTLADEEKAKWDVEKQEEKEEAVEEVTKPVEKKEEKLVTRTRQVSEKKADGDFWTQAKASGWKLIDDFKSELGDSVKNIIFNDDPKKVKFEIIVDGEKLPDDNYLECPDCHVFGPDVVDYCPVCGCKFS